jgi:ABC-2 type transport system permease protein
MKKYYYIFRVSFMENLQYPMNSILGFISYFLMIFVFFQLWNYIYTDPSAIIAGYTRQQMIWYVIFTEIMWYGTRSTTLTGGMSRDIKSGTVAYSINKPYYYPLYILAKYLGEIGFRFLLYSILGSLLGLLLLGAIPGFHLVTITAVVPVMFLGLLINSLIRINISILSFWVEDALPFQWLYDKLLIVLGIMFPVEVFPDILQPIIRVLPIYAVTYGPAKLVVDFSAEVLVKILLVQGSYLGILTLIMVFLYEKGVRKLNVNGG